jgi:hypothetical protein
MINRRYSISPRLVIAQPPRYGPRVDLSNFKGQEHGRIDSNRQVPTQSIPRQGIKVLLRLVGGNDIARCHNVHAKPLRRTTLRREESLHPIAPGS